MPGVMLLTMLLCFVLSVSVAISIGMAGLLGVMTNDALPLVVVPKEMFASLDKFPLLAIPFFVLAGKLMEEGGISNRLVEFAKSLVGGMQGGLAMSCVVTCLIFACVSGSSVATTFAVGAILIPALVRMGYPVNFVASLQATSAELGVIIPPSVPMILYGVTAEVSIGEMFVAGIGPGILIAAALMLYVLIWARVTGHGKHDGEGRFKVLAATRQSIWALMMPVIILGGIYGGIFTPTEASAVAVVYALVVGVCIYKGLPISAVPRVLRQSAVTTAVIMFIRHPRSAGRISEANADLAAKLSHRREHCAVSDRHVRRNRRRHHRARAHPGAGGGLLRHRPRALRLDHHRQPCLGHDHAAGGRQSVRSVRGSQDIARQHGETFDRVRGRHHRLPGVDHDVSGDLAHPARLGLSMNPSMEPPS